MTPEKLANLIDRYGSSLESWPNVRQRTAAQELLTRSEAARSLLRRARGLERCLRPPEGNLIDRAFESTVTGSTGERLIARILDQAKRTPQPAPPLQFRARGLRDRLWSLVDNNLWCYGLPATVALVLGIMVGHATVDQVTYSEGQSSVEYLIRSTHTVGSFEL